MKKIIFLLLLAQTISFLYACPNCVGYRRYQGTEGAISDPTDKNAWRWGVKPPLKIQCYCDCAKYAKANGKCLGCFHKVLPDDMKLSNSEEATPVIHTMTIKNNDTSYETKAERKKGNKAKRKAKKQAQKNQQNVA